MITRTVLVRGLAVGVALGAIACGRFGIDRRDAHGMTALMRAARQGDSAEVARLISRGAGVNATVPTRDIREMIAFLSWMQQLPESDIGYQALHYAVQGDHRNVAQLLIKHGSDVSHADRGGTTPLRLAIHRRNVEMMQLLLSSRAKIAPRDLWIATSSAPAPAIALLIQQGASVHGPIPDPSFKTQPPLPPLAIVAATRGDAEVLKVLIEAGVDINARDRHGWTALRWAKQREGRRPGQSGTAEIVALLEGTGAKDASGERASQLFDAIHAKDTAAVRRALASGANPNARDDRGVPVLVDAAAFGLGDVVAMLVDAGARVNANPQNGTTPLIAAIEGGSLDAVRKLLAAGANPQQPDHIRRMPMDVASNHKRTEMTRLLLESAPTVAPPPNALPMAALAGSVDQVKLLLERGAQVNAGKGHALSEAIRGCTRNDNSEVVRVLLDAGADPNLYGDMSPLSRAAGLCPAVVVRLLLARGANPNVGGEYGWPPLSAAAFDGNLEVVRILIAAKADVNARDREGKTALQHAARHPAVQQELRAAGAR